MKRWLWTAALLGCAFVAMAQLPRPGEKLPASKVSTVGLPSGDLQTNITNAEICVAPCAGGSGKPISVNDGSGTISITDPLGLNFVEGTNITFTYAANGASQDSLTIASTGGGSVTDGLKSDINVTGSGANWDIVANAVTLGTDTTGGYAGSLTEGGAATSVAANSVALGGDTTGGYAASATEGGAASSVAVNSVTLGTDTTGNYAGSSSEGGAATTASALAADPANCSAGNYPLGVDATGAVQGCTVASGSGTITAVGPYTSGGAFVDGVTQTGGTPMLIWEGATNDVFELRILAPPDPTADIDVTFPALSGKLVGTGSVTALPGSPAAGDIIIVTDDPSAGACTSAGGTAISICRWSGSAWVPLGDGGSGGTGNITAVGDCAPGSPTPCFTGATGTTLSSNTDVKFEIDKDNSTADATGTAALRLYAGATEFFNINEAGQSTLVAPAGSDPKITFTDADTNDTADSGTIRFEKAGSICWEANTPGADVCLNKGTGDQLTIANGRLALGEVCDTVGGAGIGCLGSDGVNWFIETGTPDNVYQDGEYMLTMNAPVNDNGNQIIQGDLTSTGEFFALDLINLHPTVTPSTTEAAMTWNSTTDQIQVGAGASATATFNPGIFTSFQTARWTSPAPTLNTIVSTGPCNDSYNSGGALAPIPCTSYEFGQHFNAQVRIRQLSCMGELLNFDPNDKVELCLTQIQLPGLAETALCGAGQVILFDTDGTGFEQKTINVNIPTTLTSNYVLMLKNANIVDTTDGTERFRSQCRVTVQIP